MLYCESECHRVEVARTHMILFLCVAANTFSQCGPHCCCPCSAEVEESTECSQPPATGKVGIQYSCLGMCCVQNLQQCSSISGPSHNILQHPFQAGIGCLCHSSAHWDSARLHACPGVPSQCAHRIWNPRCAQVPPESLSPILMPQWSRTGLRCGRIRVWDRTNLFGDMCVCCWRC